MSDLLQDCYAESYQRTLGDMVKQAVGAGIRPGSIVNMGRRAVQSELGRDIYRASQSPSSSYWNTLRNLALPGFNRIPHAKVMEDEAGAGIKRLREAMRSKYTSDPKANMANPEIKRLRDEIRKLTGGYRAERDMNFAEIGAAAEPRINFMRKAAPAALGLGAGGAVAGGAGLYAGAQEGKYNAASRTANMPLLQRIQHLFAPQTTTAGMFYPKTRPQKPQP